MIAWRRSSPESLKKAFFWPTVGGVGLILVLLASGIRHFYALMSFGLCLFVTITVFGEFFKGAQAIRLKDGKNLLAGTKRAGNILGIEEKKDKRSFEGAPDPSLYKLNEEKALAKAIDQVKSEAGAAVAKEDFAGAMTAMAKLRPAVDAFFDKVKVNDDEPKVRENRLKLLNEIRAATRAVADFSKIEG